MQVNDDTTMTTSPPTARMSRIRRAWVALAAVAVLITGASMAGDALAAAGPKPTAKALGADVVKLSWTARSGAAKYTVRYSTSSKMSSPTTVTKVDGKDITTAFTNVSGLSAEKTYYFQVIGVNAAGKNLDTWGNTSSGAKTFYSYTAPTGLAAANIASTWVELSWQNVSGAPGYRVRYYNRTDKAQFVWNQVENFTLHGKNDSDKLRKNTQYWISVAVQQPPIGTPGTSGYTPLVTMSKLSKEITLTTSNYDIVAPGDLTVTQQKPTSVRVGWDKPSGFESGMKYRVQYSTSSSMSGAKSVDVTDTNVTLTGLAENTTYYVRVMVVDAEGVQKSDRSAFQIAKTRVPRGTVKGTVTGPNGRDVVALVYNTGGELVAEADVASNGNYSASVRPGSYKVLLSYLGDDGYTSMWASSSTAGGVPVSSQGSTYKVGSAGATATASSVKLAKGASLSGLVRYNGAGLNGVYLTSLTAHTSARETEAVTQTPSDSTTAGRYIIKGLSEGEHWLRFTRAGYKNVSVWVKVAGARVTQYRVSTQASPSNLAAGQTLNVNMSK